MGNIVLSMGNSRDSVAESLRRKVVQFLSGYNNGLHIAWGNII